MKAHRRELLDRAIAAMVAAIDVYNKPDFRYRAESFTILALNAWELLLKAKWLTINNNKLSSLYVRQGGSNKRQRYKRAQSKNPLTHGMRYLMGELVKQGFLDAKCRDNLEVLTEFRNTSIHFYHYRNPELAKKVQEIGMASVMNFVHAVQDWFAQDLSGIDFYPMPLSFVALPPTTKAIQLNQEEQRFLRYVSQYEKRDKNGRYAVAIDVEIRFKQSNSAAAAPVRQTAAPDAVLVQLTEEDMRRQYPWDYRELTKRCKSQIPDFKENKKYHQLRKPLEGDTRYTYVRSLDPKNPKSTKKVFYNYKALEKLRAEYSKET